MKNTILCVFVLAATFYQVAAQWKNVKSTSIGFKIKNAGIGVDGSFKKASIQIIVDENNPTASMFVGVVEANSINTGIKLRDNHLREKEEFFNVEKFPTLTMKSVSVTQKSMGVYTVVWDLTMKGNTRRFTSEVISKVDANQLYLSTEFKINRNDWKIGGSSITMGDNLTVKLKSAVSK